MLAILLRLHRLPALCIFLFCLSPVSAQEKTNDFRIKEIGTPFINTYFPADYGAHEQTFAIDQAANGIMYFANVTGVLEFDGQRWNTDSRISEDSFKDVVVGPTGRIYATSKGLFGYLEPNATGELVFKSLVPKAPLEFENKGNITNSDLVGNKVVFRGADNLLLYDIELDTISLIVTNNRFGESDKVGDEYYLMDYSRGLTRLDGDLLELMPNAQQFLGMTVRKILRFTENQLLILTEDNGLFLYDFKQLVPWETEVSTFLKSFKGFSGLNIIDKYFALGTENGGVVIIDRSGRLIQKLNKSTGLPGDGLVQDLFLDKNNDLWVAQHGAIHHVILNSPFTTLDERHGVNGYVLFFQKHAGNTYVGTAKGMVYKPDDAPWQKTSDYKPFIPVTKSQERVWMFVKHGKDFFAAGNEGMQQITTKGVKSLYKGERLWAAVSMNKADQMVIGSIEGNLHLFEKRSGDWAYAHKIKGFNQQMDFLEQTDDGDLWMTDSGSGVFKIRLNAAKDSVQSIQTYGAEDGLPDLIRNRVFRHREGLFFATVNGVYEYDKGTDRFVGVDKFNEHVKDDYVFRFVEMERGDIYASLNGRGKSLLKKKPEGYELSLNPFQRIAGHNSEYVSGLGGNGVWIAGSGIKHFDATFNNGAQEAFNSHIRSVKVSNKADSLIFGGAGVKQKMNLSPSENAIHFTYSATFYDAIEALTFHSYLEGSEETWAPWSDAVERNYTNLPHGTYTFKVQARNVYGQLSEIDEYTFTITTPWYYSLWACVLYAILIGFVVWGIVKLNSRRLEKEKDELEKIVLERTEEIRSQKEQAEAAKELIQQQADRLKELDKVKSRFFANISHELRTPLTLINAPLESLLYNGQIENSSVRETLKTAQRNGVSLLSLVEEILDLGKLEAGKLQLTENPARLKEFVEDILHSYKAGFDKKSIRVSFDFWLADDLALLLDESKCGKVFRNLLSNAFKFTNDEVSIVIQENPSDEERIQIIVKDNGEGIHANDLPYIFDRYYQSEQPGKKAEGGTGIGLALAKELAQLHNGRLSVVSEVGSGSTFTFEFQAKRVKEETVVLLAASSNETIENTLKETIVNYAAKFEVDKPVLLITEDHPEMRAFVAQTLAPYFEVMQAENGKMALDILTSHSIDIVISDVMMPVMDGFELLEAIKQNEALHEVSVVMLTARADQEDKLQALAMGIDDYLTKPFSAAEFLARIKNILENRIRIIRAFRKTDESRHDISDSIDLKQYAKEFNLSERELEVMTLLAKRFTHQEIADALFVSKNTIKYHVKNLYAKLGVTSRAQAFEALDNNVI